MDMVSDAPYGASRYLILARVRPLDTCLFIEIRTNSVLFVELMNARGANGPFIVKLTVKAKRTCSFVCKFISIFLANDGNVIIYTRKCE